MKNMSEIRHNIRSVEETRQVTNAMFLLSTSRMKRALQQIGHNQQYMRTVRAAIRNILAHMPGEHPYMAYPGGGDHYPAFLVIASDKGLCGAYNQNVTRFALQKLRAFDDYPVHVCTVGEHATHALTVGGYQPDVAFSGAAQRPDTYYSRATAEHFIQYFNEGRITSLRIIYTHYITQLRQEPRCLKLLPVQETDFTAEEALPDGDQMLLEPSADALFGQAIPQYLVGMIYDCLHQALCSEQICRMNAMQNATKNADEMLQKLQLQYNTVRQLAITNEITEIAAATELADRGV